MIIPQAGVFKKMIHTLFFLLSFFVILPVFAETRQAPLAKKEFRVCENVYQLEVAKTFESRKKGLMYSAPLKKNEGMIFVFREEAPQAFWMKNVPIGLDILFFNSKGKLLNWHSMQPDTPILLDHKKPRYESRGPAQFVVELAPQSVDSFSSKQLAQCHLSPLPVIDESVE